MTAMHISATTPSSLNSTHFFCPATVVNTAFVMLKKKCNDSQLLPLLQKRKCPWTWISGLCFVTVLWTAGRLCWKGHTIVTFHCSWLLEFHSLPLILSLLSLLLKCLPLFYVVLHLDLFSWLLLHEAVLPKSSFLLCFVFITLCANRTVYCPSWF